jgi:hypothetical protein
MPFQTCQKTASLPLPLLTQGYSSDAQSFNEDIGSWDVSRVITMMSSKCPLCPLLLPLVVCALWRRFTQGLRLFVFVSVAILCRTCTVFHMALVFNQDLTSWDVSRVNTMEHSKCPLCPLSLSLVVCALWQRFTLGLRPFVVVSVVALCRTCTVFRRAELFNQDLSSWDMSHVTTVESSKCPRCSLSLPLVDL